MISRENQPFEGDYRSDQWPTERAPRGTVPPEIRARVLQEVASGRKSIDVAREYGVHHTTITKWKREERERGGAPGAELPRQPAEPVEAVSAPPRETGRYSKAFKEDVLAQVGSGRKVVEVASQYGVPTGTISRWRHEARSAGGELPEPKSTRPRHRSTKSIVDSSSPSRSATQTWAWHRSKTSSGALRR
jgi:transposase-like protein